MKKNILIIGAGGVAHVAAHKVAWSGGFAELHIASRSLHKADAIVASIRDRGDPGATVLRTHVLDALDVTATTALIRGIRADIVLNLGSAFLNMSVLEACLRTGAAYIDTAIHEEPDRICEPPPWYANHEWKRREACAQAGVTAILGTGFDPGVVNAYARLAVDEYFDRIDAIDIIDINAGSHGRYFATNFDPEINFREFTGTVWYWQERKWRSAGMFEIRREWDLPVVGRQTTYLTGHDELHSLSRYLDVPDIRFWMGFGEHYINVFSVLKNLGLLSVQPVRTAEGLEVVPLKVVKAVLPDPASLAATYTGKTCIGDRVRGVKDGKVREIFLYNISDHAESYREVGSQAISYTAGVPAAAAALLIARGDWHVRRMANVEELPARPFLEQLAELGMETWLREGGRDWPVAMQQEPVRA
ncbi:MAG TPA: saccharopine dehydrogenase family protein [Thiobacillaceae bacterium]|nr:saccharopine dehydrogenase family protein [Thiobacillaceae bacterium]HNU65115.1 saccharopine dehydrogenase family protein [Thiobacillaceae bacterium]